MGLTLVGCDLVSEENSFRQYGVQVISPGDSKTLYHFQDYERVSEEDGSTTFRGTRLYSGDSLEVNIPSGWTIAVSVTN